MPYKDPEKKKAYQKEYARKNAEKAKRKSKEWYEANKEYALDRQQKYYLEHREERLAFGKKWRRSNSGKASRRRSQNVYKERHPEKYHCNNVFKGAVRRGKIKRLPCEICGSGNSQGHHADYSKPYEVRWFCDKHHKEIEGKLLD